MTSPATGSRAVIAPLRSERTLHICVLSAFAFSEPLFAVLTQQFLYLHDLQAGWAEILFVMLVLAVIVPMICVLLDQLVLRLASLWGGTGRDIVLLVLTVLVSLSILRPLLRIHFLVVKACVWIVTLAIASPLSVLFVYFYRRSQWIRHWVSAATVGLVCFPGLFAYRYSLLERTDSLQRSEALKHRIPVESPVPVIFIIFDEFSGTALMNQELQLDAEHFPHFARLGEISTWYRNSSTVHCRTDVAVPAILSGRFPTVKRPPLEAEYPGNLLQTIHATGSFRMVVFEPATRLGPADLVVRKVIQKRTFLQKIGSMTQVMATVYPRLIFPDDMPIDFPPISKIWFGLPEVLSGDEILDHGLIRLMPFDKRDNQLRHFLDCVRPSDLPQFCFLHVELPHLPWHFLPSGHYYNYEHGAEFDPLGAWGDLGEDWDRDPAIVARNEHRHLLQLGFVDRFIGQLLDRLQETGLLDQCLLIVTADHGVSVRPNHSRRIPDAETLPDILSVPLFIKLPGQTSGAVSDANVESVDILPTIAEILGLTLPEPVDGTSVTNDKRRLRKSFFVEQTMTALEPAIPGLDAAVQRRRAIFGSGSWDRPPLMTASHPDWHGRSIREFTIEDRPLDGVQIEDPKPSADVGASEFVPCLVRGCVETRSLQTPVADLVVVVNDVICDSGHSCGHRFGLQGFEFLLSESLAKQPPGHVEVFLVEPAPGGKPRLRRVATWKLPVKI